MGLKFNNIEEMIRYLDSKAVEHSQTVYETTLDHSELSIENVERNLAQLHEYYVVSGSLAGILGLAMFYGAYVGEVIRRNHFSEASWEGDASGRAFPSLRWRARHGGNSIVFPMNWCYVRMVKGPEDNVLVKYQVSVVGDEAIVEVAEQMREHGEE